MSQAVGKPAHNPGQIDITVRDQNQNATAFRIKKTLKLGKLKVAYCDRMGVDSGAIRFRYDGVAVRDDQSPIDLEMEDGDVIDAFLEQIGGIGTAGSSTVTEVTEHFSSLALDRKLKPGPKILVNIRNEDGAVTSFKMAPTALFGKLKVMFCRLSGLDLNKVDLHFNGQRVDVLKTPHEMGIKDAVLLEANLSHRTICSQGCRSRPFGGFIRIRAICGPEYIPK